MFVGIKGQEPIIDGMFSTDVKFEDVEWELAPDGKMITMNIEKLKELWWSQVITSDPELAITRIRNQNVSYRKIE